MAEYIDREDMIRHLDILYGRMAAKTPQFYNGFMLARNYVNEFPAADVVPKAVFEQVRWERDTAVAQLREDYGVELGERRRQ